FGGNQLAVLPEASGLSTEGMQRIAREFNFAETTFVLPSRDTGSKQNAHNAFRVRIFTPRAEVPFAGHPTVGTACALVMGGYAGPGDRHTLILEEGVGPVSVDVIREGGGWSGTLTLTSRLEQPVTAPGAEALAAVLSLSPGDIKRTFFASV